ncbi:ABC transporter permease [Sporomusa termitida]|uniref:Aliphatic sulfonates transport permease protein SsuC n=1 Tax=Sporomusa termitida TaxID=2377 RepID=A0A517E1A4_9FIRM|nr:ABC transporter permease [Sporomusa termitida]QDR83385.1 Putative aliphatic sulfonates transport permease protein SsuC [Sporomusa termitida]
MRKPTLIEIKNDLLLFLKNSFGSFVTPAFATVFIPILLAWELLPLFEVIPDGLLPRLSTVAVSFYDALVDADMHGNRLLDHLAISVLRFFIGFFIALLLAVPLGMLMGWSVFIRKHLLPLFQLFAPIPPPAWVPITIIFLGVDLRMQSFLVFLGVFYPVLFNSYTGTKDTNSRLINTARLFGASEFTILCQVVFPSALSSILMGMKIGTAMGIVCLVLAEMFGASSGLGWMLMESKHYFQIDRMMVTMVMLGGFGWFMIEILKFIELKLSLWKIGEVTG